MCTLEKRGNLFILTITGDHEHRLNPNLIDSIRASVSWAKSESESMGPTALLTTAQGKFFSNGFDLSWAQSDPDPVKARAQVRLGVMSKKLSLLVEELISLPMPTIAVVTGHAAAAGFILALCHDYLLMRKDRGFIYMSELDIKLLPPQWFYSVVQGKISSPKIWRNVFLRSEKITAAVGVEWGIVDSAHETAEGTLAAAVALGMDLIGRNWDGNVYANIRKTVFAAVLAGIRRAEWVGDSGEGEGMEVQKKAVSRL